MMLHWWKILHYTKSCDCATRKAEKVQYLGSRLPNGATLVEDFALHEKQR